MKHSFSDVSRRKVFQLMRPADRRHQVVDLAADRSLGSTRVVSWNEAVEMNDSVESDAFVIPGRQRLTRFPASLNISSANNTSLPQ